MNNGHARQNKIPMTFDGVFENMPIPMFLIDHERHVVKMNIATFKAVKQTMEDPIGQRLGNAVHCVHSVEDPKGCGFGPHCGQCPLRDAIQKCFDAQKNLEMTEVKLDVYIKANYSASVYLWVTALLLSDGEKQHLLVCLFDNTKQKETEKFLQKQVAELKKAQ
jgi:hypothetical protein